MNPWANLFVDRRKAVAETPAAEILAYVRQDNYHEPDGGIRLARTLAEVPADWDADGDGHWRGYVPDVAFRFDEEGRLVSVEGRPGRQSDPAARSRAVVTGEPLPPRQGGPL